jgi:hypothetical protein
MNLAGDAEHPNRVAARDWCVMRQDDNGNRFVVVRGVTEAEARELAAAYAARGHKQLYWIEPCASDPPAAPAPASRR